MLAEGPTKASIWLAGGLQIDLRVLPEHLYGNLLQHFTGSREHNIQLRELAVRKNLRVSENGIVDLTDGRTITCRTEAEVYAALGLGVHSARDAPGHRRDRGRARRHAAAGRRAGRPARRLPHALHLDRRARHARGDDRRLRRARLRLPLDLATTRGAAARDRARPGRPARAARRGCASWASGTASARCARPRSTSSPTARSTTTTRSWPNWTSWSPASTRRSTSRARR